MSTASTTTTAVEPSQVSQATWRPLSKPAVYRIMVAIMILISALLTVRMRNTAFIDEALYINAGHAYLDYWRTGTPLGDAGTFFSGAPVLYPVLAALIDSLGGLLLVRAFSMLCIVLAALTLRSVATHLWGPRAGLLTLATFLLTGPIIFMAGLATFDALVVLMLSASLWLAVTRKGMWSAVLLGLLLPLMVATKYTAMIFVPVIIAAAFVTAKRGSIARVFVTMGIAFTVTSVAYLGWGHLIQESLSFTTTARKALSPSNAPILLGYVWRYIGLLVVLAVIGAVVTSIMDKRPRSVLIAVGLLGAAAVLPAGQIYMNEEVSFQKHLGYSAVFLALLAGIGLARLSKLPLMAPPIALLLACAAMIGWARSDVMYDWVNVAPIVRIIEAKPIPGVYVSSATDSLDYHTKDLPGIEWQTSFSLYSEGPEGIRDAVKKRRFQTIILRTDSTGSASQDASQQVLVDALEKSPGYGLAYKPFKVARYGDDRWLVYTRVPTVEPEVLDAGFGGDSKKGGNTKPR